MSLREANLERRGRAGLQHGPGPESNANCLARPRRLRGFFVSSVVRRAVSQLRQRTPPAFEHLLDLPRIGQGAGDAGCVDDVRPVCRDRRLTVDPACDAPAELRPQRWAGLHPIGGTAPAILLLQHIGFDHRDSSSVVRAANHRCVGAGVQGGNGR